MPDARITPCLWFDGQAEDAANFYVGIFPNSRITTVSAMVVVFELDGVGFTGLNGGPKFKFTEAVSFQVYCKDQKEIDYYWEKLGAGGDPKAQQCGWLKDRFGLSWQVVPRNMGKLLSDETAAGSQRAMQAMLKMKKIDIAEILRAKAGAA